MKCPVSGDSSYLLMYSPQYGALLFPLFRGRVINNTACRQGGKHQRGVETEEVHACMGIWSSLLLSAAAHLAIKNVLCALFVPQRAKTPGRSLLSFHQGCQLKAFRTHSSRSCCPRNTERSLH